MTFGFKVTRESHAMGNSWNDFLELNNLANKKVYRSSTTTTVIKNHALKYDAFDVIGNIIGVTWNFKTILHLRVFDLSNV